MTYQAAAFTLSEKWSRKQRAVLSVLELNKPITPQLMSLISAGLHTSCFVHWTILMACGGKVKYFSVVVLEDAVHVGFICTSAFPLYV